MIDTCEEHVFIRSLAMVESQFLMHKYIPVKEDSNNQVLQYNDDCVQQKWDFVVVSSKFRNRNSIYIVAVYLAVLAFSAYLYYAVDARNGYHKTKGDKHHFDEGKVKAYWLIDLVDVRNRTVECKRLFHVLIAAWTTGILVLSVGAKRSSILVQLAYR